MNVSHRPAFCTCYIYILDAVNPSSLCYKYMALQHENLFCLGPFNVSL